MGFYSTPAFHLLKVELFFYFQSPLGSSPISHSDAEGDVREKVWRKRTDFHSNPYSGRTWLLPDDAGGLVGIIIVKLDYFTHTRVSSI